MLQRATRSSERSACTAKTVASDECEKASGGTELKRDDGILVV